MMKPIRPHTIELPDDTMVGILRAKTPAERLAIAFGCNRTMRLMLAAHFRGRNQKWSEDEIAAAVAERLLHGAG